MVPLDLFWSVFYFWLDQKLYTQFNGYRLYVIYYYYYYYYFSLFIPLFFFSGYSSYCYERHKPTVEKTWKTMEETNCHAENWRGCHHIGSHRWRGANHSGWKRHGLKGDSLHCSRQWTARAGLDLPAGWLPISLGRRARLRLQPPELKGRPLWRRWWHEPWQAQWFGPATLFQEKKKFFLKLVFL